MKNILRIVFLGLVGFSLLVYLTVPDFTNSEKNIENISFSMLPKYFDVVGKNPYTKKEEIFKSDEKIYLIILNHDSLAVFKDLYKFTEKNIVLVANISNTPWLIKQIAVNGELENMYKNSQISLINDSDGAVIKALNLSDNSVNNYFVYTIVDENIEKIFKGSVKRGALQDGISQDEINKDLEKFIKKLD